MSLYDDLADVSLELLGEFGQDVTRRAYSAGTYDPATGLTTPTTADTTRKGAIFDFGAGVALINGGLVQVGDKRLLCDAEGIVNIQDNFIVGGVLYVIISVGEENPAGTRVLFDLHLRGVG